MKVTRVMADMAAAVIRDDNPQSLTGAVLYAALREAEAMADTKSEQQEIVPNDGHGTPAQYGRF